MRKRDVWGNRLWELRTEFGSEVARGDLVRQNGCLCEAFMVAGGYPPLRDEGQGKVDLIAASGLWSEVTPQDFGLRWVLVPQHLTRGE